MVQLDPDDPKPPFQQVANHLRAVILTGELAPGDRLPTGGQLTKMYGVARMTIHKALQVLRDEGLIVSRQGSGVYVRERTTRPVGLRPHIEAAFDGPSVLIDFAGFSGETLHGALVEPLDKIRNGRYTPEQIQIRAIVPDTRDPWALPSNVEDLTDNPAFRARAQSIIARHSLAVVEAVHELESLGLVANAKAEVRVIRSVQLFKLYVINRQELFFGFYPIRRRTITLDGTDHEIYDLMGKAATLFRHQAGGDGTDTDSLYVNEALTWFESVWDTVAQPMP